MQKQRLTECGFTIADVAFRGVGDRELYFATRVDRASGAKHWFVIDFVAGQLQRLSKRDAVPLQCSIHEACTVHFPVDVGLREMTFLDRCRVVGFVRIEPSKHSLPAFQNHWGSMGDGTRWLLCERSEKLIRFDVQPWEDWQLDGCRMRRCSSDATPAAVIEQKKHSPVKTLPLRRSISDEPMPAVEHSGRNLQEALF